jgi:hypothetical protein
MVSKSCCRLLRLPCVLRCSTAIWPFPLSMCLMLAGYPQYNLPSDVPLEFLMFNTSETANSIVRNILNPITKRATTLLCNTLFSGSRRVVRKQLGLPPVGLAALRNEDGTPSRELSKWNGQCVVPQTVPRAIYLAGVTWEMVSVTSPNLGAKCEPCVSTRVQLFTVLTQTRPGIGIGVRPAAVQCIAIALERLFYAANAKPCKLHSRAGHAKPVVHTNLCNLVSSACVCTDPCGAQ